MTKPTKPKDPLAEIRKLKKENHMLKVAMGAMIATWNNIAEGEITTRCPICHDPYVFYPKVIGDQSACQWCKKQARKAVS